MDYKEIIKLNIDNITNQLEILKSSGLSKKEALLEKRHANLLMEISKQEEINLSKLLISMKELNEFLNLIQANNLKTLVSNCNDEDLDYKYNNLVKLENEVKKINSFNHEIVSQCSSVNTHYLNLLYPQEDNGYNMDSSLINKKLKNYL